MPVSRAGLLQPSFQRVPLQRLRPRFFEQLHQAVHRRAAEAGTGVD